MERFRQFYTENRERFFGYLLRRTGDWQQAADAMQESFTRYMERYGRSEPNTSLLYTIGRNLVTDAGRRQRPTQEFDEECHRGYPDEEAVYLRREQARRVLEAIGQLAPEDADLLSLVVSGELTYREIGTITGMSEANIKVKVHRIRRQVRDILQKEMP